MAKLPHFNLHWGVKIVQRVTEPCEIVITFFMDDLGNVQMVKGRRWHSSYQKKGGKMARWVIYSLQGWYIGQSEQQ